MIKKEHFDDIINQKIYSAIVFCQPLKSVEGHHAVVFPPTYASGSKDKPSGYNFDIIEGSKEIRNVCTIDSEGSQGNRIEPIFKELPYCDFVPQIHLNIKRPGSNSEKNKELLNSVNLLDVAHRAADAIVRFSDAEDTILKCFNALLNGDAAPLARFSPTSLVFGCWDSRVTSARIPRMVKSVIRAINVSRLTRSAQYVPAIDNYKDAFETLSDKDKKKFSDVGMAHVPSIGVPGGVILDSDSKILRSAILSLTLLRSLHTRTAEETLKLQRYILGLALIAITAPQNPFLRMGCELTCDPENPVAWELVEYTGNRSLFSASHEDAIAYAQTVSEDFGVGQSQTVTFDSRKALHALREK